MTTASLELESDYAAGPPQGTRPQGTCLNGSLAHILKRTQTCIDSKDHAQVRVGLREHVYRKHALPISCPRCHTSFESEKQKDEHIAASVRCEAREVIASTEGMSTTQKEQLRSRKKSAKYVTEAEKWRQMYLILFPNADLASIPSPYYEYASSSLDFPSQEMSRYEQFLQQELPDSVREELELRIDQYLNPIEASLRCQLVGIVRDMQIRLFDLYKSMQYGNMNGADIEGIPDIDTDRFPVPRTDEDVDDVNNFEDELQHLCQPPYLEQLPDFEGLEDLDFSFSVPQSSSAILDPGDQYLFHDSEGRQTDIGNK
ncbi:unnamed protein product [Clonostachys byssicola]|uniref:C2H2-type domain-containing protein n=1 Tax=Clonostachys byssicola TaxID=160290 RepID=A0A9N9UJ88_9HYPO|nr:unnamed protein product [Clonostachys byssicola]